MNAQVVGTVFRFRKPWGRRKTPRRKPRDLPRNSSSNEKRPLKATLLSRRQRRHNACDIHADPVPHAAAHYGHARRIFRKRLWRHCIRDRLEKAQIAQTLPNGEKSRTKLPISVQERSIQPQPHDPSAGQIRRCRLRNQQWTPAAHHLAAAPYAHEHRIRSVRPERTREPKTHFFGSAHRNNRIGP